MNYLQPTHGTPAAWQTVGGRFFCGDVEESWEMSGGRRATFPSRRDKAVLSAANVKTGETMPLMFEEIATLNWH